MLLLDEKMLLFRNEGAFLKSAMLFMFSFKFRLLFIEKSFVDFRMSLFPPPPPPLQN
jgi:hypothetical protein